MMLGRVLQLAGRRSGLQRGACCDLVIARQIMFDCKVNMSLCRYAGLAVLSLGLHWFVFPCSGVLGRTRAFSWQLQVQWNATSPQPQGSQQPAAAAAAMLRHRLRCLSTGTRQQRQPAAKPKAAVDPATDDEDDADQGGAVAVGAVPGSTWVPGPAMLRCLPTPPGCMHCASPCALRPWRPWRAHAGNLSAADDEFLDDWEELEEDMGPELSTGGVDW